MSTIEEISRALRQRDKYYQIDVRASLDLAKAVYYRLRELGFQDGILKRESFPACMEGRPIGYLYLNPVTGVSGWDAADRIYDHPRPELSVEELFVVPKRVTVQVGDDLEYSYYRVPEQVAVKVNELCSAASLV